MTKKQEWFEEWFDTKYYHILYQDRNDDEAQFFMRNLTDFIHLNKGSKLLDLPCGKGRHSVYLNSLGYDVIGADLSKNSILHAKQFENETLKFEVHDMRDEFMTKFDAILNLFTSFGYFDDDKIDIAVLKNLKNGLRNNGLLVIDFLNVDYVINNLIIEETITKNEIDFNISRYLENGFIIKEINFDVDNKHHTYFEKVKVLPLEKIKSYASEASFTIKHIFGDYSLNKFNKESSERLILVLE